MQFAHKYAHEHITGCWSGTPERGAQGGHRPPCPLVRGAGGGESALRVKILTQKYEVQRLKSMNYA
jgi:hypothetical protein